MLLVPVSALVSSQVSLPVSAPVTPPISTPVSHPVSPPISAPVSASGPSQELDDESSEVLIEQPSSNNTSELS
jgi:hypothetical protein